MVSSQAKRNAVKHLAAERSFSERGVCKLVGINRSGARYQPNERPEEAAFRGRVRDQPVQVVLRKQFVFPFSDESVVRATFAFKSRARYTHGHRVKPILKAALETQLPVAGTSQPKGWSGMGEQTLFGWMQDGELCELVQDIERPGFMNQADFERKLEHPDWFTWNLLTIDVFKKEVLGD